MMDGRLQRTIQLTDGRQLGYAEYGDPNGTPVLFFHGTPGSRLVSFPGWDDRSAGIRLIAPDRPGIGLSDHKHGRTLLDWAQDVRELADRLELERFVVAGASGGGPHSLACAHALKQRVTRAGVICGGGPMDLPGAREHMNAGNRMAFKLAESAPFALRALFGLTSLIAKVKPDLMLGEKGLPPADRDILRDPAIRASFLAAAPEATRQGVRAIVDEAVLFTKPWGFRLEEIETPVSLWHGTEDRNAPIEMAREMERRLPECTATYYEGEGHLFIVRRWPTIAQELTR